MGGASLTHDTTDGRGRERPRGAAVRRVGARRGRARGAPRGLPAGQRAGRRSRSGVPARRLAGVAGAEIDLRWRWADLDVIPSARIEVMQDAVSRRDARGVRRSTDTPAVFRRVAGAARRRWSARWSTADAEGRSPRRTSGATRACRRSSSSTATAPRSCWATPISCPSTARTPTSALWIDRAGDRLGLASRTTVFGALRRRSDPVAILVLGAGARRQPGARAHRSASSRSCGCRSGAGAGWSGRGRTSTRAIDSDNAGGERQAAARITRAIAATCVPSWCAIALPAGLELGAYADAELRMQQLHRRREPAGPRPRVLVGCGVIARLAARAAAR